MDVKDVGGQDPRAYMSPSRPQAGSNGTPRLEAAKPAEAGSVAAVSAETAAKRVPDLVEREVLRPARAGTRLRMDDATDRIGASIIDRQYQTLKQIPPEELLAVLRRVRELEGLLFDERA